MVAVSTSTSVWQTTSKGASYPTLTQNIGVDVAIVGGGITGLTTALLLKRAGLSVAVLEGHQISGGVTAYTTAHITETPDIGYQELISNFGEAGARLAVQSRRAAIEQIAQIVVDEKIDCQFQRVSGYLYTESAQDISMLEKEVEAAQKLGVQAEVTRNLPLPFHTEVGIHFPNQAEFQPVAYLRALAQAVDGGESHVFERSRVRKISTGSPYQVHTDRGVVTANQVVLATHTPIHDIANMQDLYLLATKLEPYRSYVIAARLRSPVPVGLFWDTAEPYHYTRNYADTKGDLLIVGGADHKTGADVDELSHYQQLESYVRERYEVESIEYRWSAQWYEPVDGLPYIGKSPAHDHLYIGTGYSGNGMTFGTVAALVLSDQILGRENPWSNLYDPSRIKPLAGAQNFIAQNLEVAGRLVGDRFQSDVQSLTEVPRGEGRLVKVEGEQLAAYRDDGGTLHTQSPVCTHAGCIVHWNNAEKSWDCPCHGGRYSATGEVLNGPPIRGLEPKAVKE